MWSDKISFWTDEGKAEADLKTVFGLIEQANQEYHKVMERKEKLRIRREEAKARDAEKLKELSERLHKI